jgi:hypothetical protein
VSTGTCHGLRTSPLRRSVRHPPAVSAPTMHSGRPSLLTVASSRSIRLHASSSSWRAARRSSTFSPSNWKPPSGPHEHGSAYQGVRRLEQLDHAQHVAHSSSARGHACRRRGGRWRRKLLSDRASRSSPAISWPSWPRGPRGSFPGDRLELPGAGGQGPWAGAGARVCAPPSRSPTTSGGRCP